MHVHVYIAWRVFDGVHLNRKTSNPKSGVDMHPVRTQTHIKCARFETTAHMIDAQIKSNFFHMNERNSPNNRRRMGPFWYIPSLDAVGCRQQLNWTFPVVMELSTRTTNTNKTN